MTYEVKDSGERMEFESGMVRDTSEGKADYSLVYDGPMLDRWAVHLSKGADKYTPRNWMLARGEEEMARFRASAARHFAQWMNGETDEDHAAAVFFNINGFEYVKGGGSATEEGWIPPVKAQPAVYIGGGATLDEYVDSISIEKSMLRELGPISGKDVQLAVRIDGGEELAEDYNYMKERVRQLEIDIAVARTLLDGPLH